MACKHTTLRAALHLLALAVFGCSQAGAPATGGSGNGSTTGDALTADGTVGSASDATTDSSASSGDVAVVEILSDGVATDATDTPSDVAASDSPKTELPKPDVPKVEVGPDVASDTGAPSCVGFCGDQSDDGCYCDAECTDNGDCCPDYEKVCGGGPTTGGSCVGKCGGKGTGNCYCDNVCKQSGDCCADYDKECGGSGGPGSCAGKCGGKGTGNCYCDTVCAQAGDCCSDYSKECGSTGPVNTCQGKCGGKSNGNCYCDDACAQAGDCCPDYVQTCKNVKPDASGETSVGDAGPSDGGPKPDGGVSDTVADSKPDGDTEVAAGPCAMTCYLGEYCDFATGSCKPLLCSYPAAVGPNVQKIIEWNLAAGSVGCDLDGDGKANNAIGSGLNAFLNQFNGPMANAIADGSLVMLLDAPGYVTDGKPFAVNLLNGVVDPTAPACDLKSASSNCKVQVQANSYLGSSPAGVCKAVSQGNATVANLTLAMQAPTVAGPLSGFGSVFGWLGNMPSTWSATVEDPLAWKSSTKGLACGYTTKDAIVAAIQALPNDAFVAFGDKASAIALLSALFKADLDVDGNGTKEGISFAFQWTSGPATVTGLTGIASQPKPGADGGPGDAVDASADVSPAGDATATADTGPPMTCATATQSADKFFLCAPQANNVGALHGKACSKDSECLYGLCLFGSPLAGYDPKLGVCSKNCGFANGGAAAACATENSGDKSYVCTIEKSFAAGNVKQDVALPSVFQLCALACDVDEDCVAANPALPFCLKASTAQLSVPLQGACAKLP